MILIWRGHVPHKGPLNEAFQSVLGKLGLSERDYTTLWANHAWILPHSSHRLQKDGKEGSFDSLGTGPFAPRMELPEHPDITHRLEHRNV